MGNGRWDSNAWAAYSRRNIAGRSASRVFSSRHMLDAYDPARITIRESRDSELNPCSTPIILASDVTGSMGMIAEIMIRQGLNTLATEIYDRKPVSDPHIMAMAIGDAFYDRAPLQVTQFEADIRLADQLKELWIEGGGGGNSGESYMLAHLFAAMKTSTDGFEKRGQKGYLFTIGDEPILEGVTRDQAASFLGIDLQSDLTSRQCIDMASRAYEVFHVVLCNEGYASYGLDKVRETFEPLLPQRILYVEDYRKVAESIVSAIQVVEGANKAAVAASWDKETAPVVANAVKDLVVRGGGGIQRLS